MRVCDGVSIVAAGALIGALGACSAPTPVPEPSATSVVDPQVMQDVVESVFPAPGDGVLRAIRLTQFARQNGIQKCGGEPGPLDSAANRPNQALFPNLNLIRERGFAEHEYIQDEDRRLEGTRPNCNLLPDVPRAEDWHNAQAAWERDVVSAAEADKALAPLKAPMAQCLSDRVGKQIDPEMPAWSFLKLADVEMLSTDDWNSRGEQVWANAYADCGKDYFARFGEVLMKQRPALIERNRELLAEFAAGLVKAGYVP